MQNSGKIEVVLMPKGNASLSRSLEILDKLEESMLNDLEPTVGGFGWWSDYDLTNDQRKYISDYLCELTSTIQNVLRDLSSILSAYNQKRATRDYQMKMRFNDLSDRVPDRPANKTEVEAGQYVNILKDQYFLKLGSLLDLMSAILIGVTGVESNIRKAEYRVFRSRQELEALFEKGTNKFRFSSDVDIREAQRRVALSMVAAIEAIEPEGWLDWCIDFRNTIIHRSPGVSFTNVVNNSLGLVDRIFDTPALVPSQSFLESAFEKNMDDVLIAEDIGQIMNSSFEAICAVVAGTLESIADLWEKRRKASVSIPQPPSQWPEASVANIGFRGFNPDYTMFRKKNTVALHPTTGRRLRGAGSRSK